MGIVVLDAGVVVAALDAADVHHAASVEALRAARDAGDRLLLPASAYAECLVWPFRVGDEAAGQADSFVDALPARVMAADRTICRTAARLRARYGTSLRLPDALVVATAIEAAADRVLTTDRGWALTEVPVQVVGGSAPTARRRARSQANRDRP